MGALGGSWGALGGLLGPSWPMWAPRANINSKKVVRWPPLPPSLGAILEPKLGLCWSMLVKNVFHDTLGKHVVSKHHFFNETWSPRAPLGHQKSSKTIGGYSKFNVFHFLSQIALGTHLGTSFGRFLGAKLRPRGTKLGPCGQKDPRKTATKTKQKNASVPGGFGEVGDGWRRGGGAQL